jgi:hypothetical protein
MHPAGALSAAEFAAAKSRLLGDGQSQPQKLGAPEWPASDR